jgi:hypothetical protein
VVGRLRRPDREEDVLESEECRFEVRKEITFAQGFYDAGLFGINATVTRSGESHYLTSLEPAG